MTWPKRVEEHGFAKAFVEQLDAHVAKHKLKFESRVTVCEDDTKGVTAEEEREQAVCDIRVLPDMIVFRKVARAHIGAVLARVVKEKPKEEKEKDKDKAKEKEKDADKADKTDSAKAAGAADDGLVCEPLECKTLVMICAHNLRDKRSVILILRVFNHCVFIVLFIAFVADCV